MERFDTKVKQNGKPGEHWRWHEGELRPFLESSLRKICQTRPVWLFVDALDDCDKENAVRLVQLFKTLLKRVAIGQFRICFSCRHYPNLDVDEIVYEICAEDENQRDISTFVNDQLATFRARTSSTIPDLITERASGVFMWARLVVEQILSLERDGAGLNEMEATIHSVPKDLDELYRQLIRGMDSTSVKLIQLICFATRPLSLNELRWAMVIEGDCPYQSLQACRSAPDHEPDSVRLKRRVLWLSRGLAEVTQTQHVQFIHQSVKDFFVETGLPALTDCETSTEAASRAHFRLAKICIRYLAMEELVPSTSYRDNDFDDNFPFLRYASTSWMAHTEQCDPSCIPHEELLALFAWPSCTLVEYGAPVDPAMEASTYEKTSLSPEGTGSMNISSTPGVLGALTVMTRKDQTSADVDAGDGYGGYGRAPLMPAARQRQEAIAKLVLSTAQANVNARDSNRETPLTWPAGYRDEAVVKLLLDTSKNNVGGKDHDGNTVLPGPAANGHEPVVQILLNTSKVDVGGKNDRSQMDSAVLGC
jgi:hypothetical protein